jgi:hypothetical protein
MLECPTLWVSPRLGGPFAGRAEAARRVHDATTRAAVGRVRYAAGTWAAAWRTSTVLTVEEGDDVALLCSVRRPPWWEGRAWWVLDADDQPVARLYGPALDVLRDGAHAAVYIEAGGLTGRVAVAGAMVGEWAPEGAGTRVRFAATTPERPFVRMAVLAVALLET